MMMKMNSNLNTIILIMEKLSSKHKYRLIVSHLLNKLNKSNLIMILKSHNFQMIMLQAINLLLIMMTSKR